MEPQHSVLLYSKYSQTCNKLFEITNSSGIDFSKILSLVCIDSEDVRKRIKNDKRFGIQTVPCLLLLYTNGTVEKYEGQDVFIWTTNIISRLNPPPPPPPPPPQQLPIPVQNPKKSMEESEEYIQENNDTDRTMPIRHGKRAKEGKLQTLIEDVPDDNNVDDNVNDNIDDRHRSIPQPRRIRQDENTYIEDPELFGDEQPDIRKESSKSIKPSSKSQDPHGILAKVKELEKGREMIDQEVGKNIKRPIDARRN
jgi:hypothetical protein